MVFEMHALKVQQKNVSLAVIIATLLLSSCSSSQEVSYKSGGMTQTFVSGKDTISAEKSFLLPIYPNSKPTGEVQAKSEEEQNSFLMLSSPDPVSKVSDFYQAELKKGGWELHQNQMLSELVNLTAKKDRLEGSIMISSDGKNQTSISLSVNVEPEGTPEVSKDEFVPDKLNPPTD